MWKDAQENWKNFTTGNADLVRHVSVAIFGSVARLATDHTKLKKFSLQDLYDIFRTFIMALVAVYIIDAVIIYFRLNGSMAIAVSLASAYYAQEVVTIIKSVLPTLKDRIMKGK